MPLSIVHLDLSSVSHGHFINSLHTSGSRSTLDFDRRVGLCYLQTSISAETSRLAIVSALNARVLPFLVCASVDRTKTPFRSSMSSPLCHSVKRAFSNPGRTWKSSWRQGKAWRGGQWGICRVLPAQSFVDDASINRTRDLVLAREVDAIAAQTGGGDDKWALQYFEPQRQRVMLRVEASF